MWRSCCFYRVIAVAALNCVRIQTEKTVKMACVPSLGGAQRSLCLSHWHASAFLNFEGARYLVEGNLLTRPCSQFHNSWGHFEFGCGRESELTCSQFTRLSGRSAFSRDVHHSKGSPAWNNGAAQCRGPRISPEWLRGSRALEIRAQVTSNQ